MLCSLASAALPHVLKRIFDRKRPDRTVVHGHRRGIPRSGNPYDSFPSGHAVHIGALATAISGMVSPQLRLAVWTPAMALAATRLVLFAHYPSDVAIGLTIGIGLERVVAAVLPRDPGEPVGELSCRRFQLSADPAGNPVPRP
jgi:undecaprenyl-diphosphatase